MSFLPWCISHSAKTGGFWLSWSTIRPNFFDMPSGKRIALITTGEKYEMLSAQLDKAGERLVVTAGPNCVPGVFRISLPKAGAVAGL